tara:strand:- start:1158 stop:2141 length:984 start_codon:yes stop_codon:yes gene_type:complete
MKNKIKRKLLIITPVDHLEGFLKKAKKNFELVNYIKNPSLNDVFKNIKNTNYIFTNPNMSKFKIDEEIINAGKKLKCICTASTGTNHIDIRYANKKNIHIISLKKYKRILEKIPSTAELAFTLMMASIRNIIPASNSVERYQWSYLEFIGEQLKEKKIGILGYGRLGRLFANFCLKFGAKVYFYDPFKKSISKKIKKVSNLKLFLKSVDILSIHIHLNESTKNFLNKSLLRYLKKNILIINTSRGEIINEDDLIKFLKKNQNSKFAADVISHELGNIFKSKLIKYFKKNKNRVLLTPHLGGSTYQAQQMAYFSSLENLIDFDNKIEH